MTDGAEPTECILNADCDNDGIIDGDEPTECILDADCDKNGIIDGDELEEPAFTGEEDPSMETSEDSEEGFELNADIDTVNVIRDGAPEISEIVKVDENSVQIKTNDMSMLISASGSEDIRVEQTTLFVGSEIILEVTGTGFAPNSEVDFYVFSTPIFLGSSQIDSYGNFTSVLTLPEGLEVGSHRFEATGIGSDQTELQVIYEFTLTEGLFQKLDLFDEPEESAKTVGSIAAVAAAVAAAGAAAGATGAAGAAGGSSGNRSGPSTYQRIAVTAASAARTRFSNEEEEDLEDSPIGWGDRRALWRTRFMTAFDYWLPLSTVRSAPFSPFVSKITNDGSYLRASLGSLWAFIPMLSVLFAFWALFNSVGPVGEPGTDGLIGLMVIGLFDTFAGVFGITIVIFGYLLVEAPTNDIAIASDLRFIIGLFSLCCGPAILATSIRKIHKPAAKKREDWWERLADIAVGTFITGWMTLIFIAVLSRYAAVSLKIGTVSNKVAVIMALGFLCRVILEESTVRLFPKRLTTISPVGIPKQLAFLKWASILNRFILSLFISLAFIGNCWHLWVGVALFTLPAVIDQFQDHFPVVKKLNRYLPHETPTLAVVQIYIVVLLGILVSTLGNSPNMIRTGYLLFPLPAIALSITNALGRKSIEGEGAWYLEPQFARWYRLGGLALLMLLVYLSEVFGTYVPMFSFT